MQSFEWGHLLSWYKKHGRHTLPWRNYTLPERERVYRVWLSEILLQQTQASRVVGFFDRMMERFPTIESLASTDYETFFPYYSGLGYYSRARNILKTAGIIVSEYGGIFPREKSLLMKLPGVGPYTAEAIQSFGYDIPTLSWDTNLEKVFARYYNCSREAKLSPEAKLIIQKDLENFLISSRMEGKEVERNGDFSFKLSKSDSSPKYSESVGHNNTKLETQDTKLYPSIRDINNALMDFASLVDLKEKSNIDWDAYPLKDSRYYRDRGASEIVKPKVSRSFPTPDAEIRIVLHRDHRVYYIPPDTNTTLSSTSLETDDENLKTGKLEKLGVPVFILPPALVRDTREYVKSYFLEHYNLHISVRPPHEKGFTPDGRPYIVCYAQIQVGTHSFGEYKKTRG